MRITFDKKISESSTQTITVLVGLTKTGDLVPYLTISALYNLIAFNSTPVSESLFTKIYNDFVGIAQFF